MLSKSTILRGKQCHKSLWLYKNQYDLRSISVVQQSVFDTGTNVGLLAQSLFPDGTDATKGFDYPSQKTAQITSDLMDKGIPIIYEATVIFNDVVVAVDILVKDRNGWNAYEVKSTNSKRNEHVADAAIQYFVLAGAGLPLNSFNLITFNSAYVRMGALNVHNLFLIHDITNEVQQLQSDLPVLIDELQAIANQPICPEVKIGPNCSRPYTCDFTAYCWKDVPYNSVFELYFGGAKAWTLFESGVRQIEDIPSDFKLTESQKIQVTAAKNNLPHIRRNLIVDFLNTLKYPIFHFDFETITPAVPMFDNSRTYQQIPFQYSVHRQDAIGSATVHSEFLATNNGHDPRPELIEKMLFDCSDVGTILTFHASFEKKCIADLARDFPQYANHLHQLIARIGDLEIPFRKKDFYTSEMKGRSSLKLVLPALVPELSYQTLAIQEGITAGNTFLQMMQGSFVGDVQKTRNHLLEYCKMDTWAMVKILEKLYEVVAFETKAIPE